MRLNDRFSVRASVLIISVFARPGTPSSRQWPRLKSADQQLFDDLVLADDDARKLLFDLLDRAPNRAIEPFCSSCMGKYLRWGNAGRSKRISRRSAENAESR